MLKNYLLIAWRQILKNKLYASINIMGLVVGLVVYIFGSMLVDYERTHDEFFANSERIFTAGSFFSATADIGVNETNGIYTAYGPLILAEVEEVEEVARTVRREFLLSIDEDHYYQRIRFTDPSFLKIFDFEYLEGDSKALEDPAGILITKSTATKFFGDQPALGRTISLNHDEHLHVTAVVADLPRNTHLNATIAGRLEFEVAAPLAVLNRVADYDLAGNFNNLSSSDFTYMLLPEDKSRDWLQAQLDAVWERHSPQDLKEFITGLNVRPLIEANTILWDAINIPVLGSLQILAMLVLVVAIVNYTNLATAQSLGRAREVGLRKTMGATRQQLLLQFMVESLTIAAIAMLIALAVLEVLVPTYNTVLNRVLVIDYSETLPWLLFTTLLVGLVAGAYPAYVITRSSPIDALRDGGKQGAKGSLFRSSMLGLQFAISMFMLAMVLIVFFQNQKVENASNIYPRSQMITLKSLNVETIRARLDTLRNELLTIPGVENVAFSAQVPYEQNNTSTEIGRISGDSDSSIMANEIVIDADFNATYDIELLAGRDFSKSIAADTVREGVLAANVVLNELATRQLGFSSPAEAINGIYYDFPESREPRAYTIVGVVPDQNFMGFHNKIKPVQFVLYPENIRIGSVRVKGAGLGETLSQIEAVWQQVIPDYPLQSEYLDSIFGQGFAIFETSSVVLGGFALVALSLSLIGLFGLAAFMAQSRTKEIGVRKVMGASVLQIVRLLVWQFSRPVMWALLVALPAAYFASSAYLNFFADRLEMPALIVIGAGLLAVVFAWAIVALHAIKIARANPIKALRYE